MHQIAPNSVSNSKKISGGIPRPCSLKKMEGRGRERIEKNGKGRKRRGIGGKGRKGRRGAKGIGIICPLHRRSAGYANDRE